MSKKLKVLVIGSGGREHALVWKLKQKQNVDLILCAPGNYGINELAYTVDIDVTDINGLKNYARASGIDLTIIGPELPLTLGIVDEFEKAGLKVFGPSKLAAEIEGSKAFSKELMAKYNIPTAKFGVFTQIEEAKSFLQEIGLPCVVKADGLAAGKGVLICHTIEEANSAVEEVLLAKAFGQAGERVVIEEFLVGEEVSLLAFTDGKTIVPMVSAQDHKRIFDNDEGPNTGGMGAYSPAPIYTPELNDRVLKEILIPTIQAMEAEGRPYKGVLYAGLMITSDGPKVLEYNARFGDPETQVILPRLKSDLIEIIEAIIEERLNELTIEWYEDAAVCVVLASGGYPGSYEKGKVISGLEDTLAGSFIFHAGTSAFNEQPVTMGGRVLGVTALGETLKDAVDLAYEAVTKISFEGMQYRKDIAAKAFKVK